MVNAVYWTHFPHLPKKTSACGHLANSLDSKSSGQGLTLIQNRMKGIFKFLISTSAYTSVPVSPFSTKLRLKSLRILKSPCLPFNKWRPIFQGHGCTQILNNNSVINERMKVVTPKGRRRRKVKHKKSLCIGRSSQILKSKQCNPLICDIKEGHKASTQTKFH